MIRWFVLVLSAGASEAVGQVMTFEGFAPPGGVVNVNPTTPYSEAGFTLTPSNSSSAVFDAAAAVDMPGNSNSSFFGWQGGNIITLTKSGGGTFALQSILLGPSTIAAGSTSIALQGFLGGGGSVTLSPPSLSTATLAAPGWTNLTSVQFSATTDSAMDNVTIPAPAGLAVLGLGGLLSARRRR